MANNLTASLSITLFCFVGFCFYGSWSPTLRRKVSIIALSTKVINSKTSTLPYFLRKTQHQVCSSWSESWITNSWGENQAGKAACRQQTFPKNSSSVNKAIWVNYYSSHDCFLWNVVPHGWSNFKTPLGWKHQSRRTATGREGQLLGMEKGPCSVCSI